MSDEPGERRRRRELERAREAATPAAGADAAPDGAPERPDDGTPATDPTAGPRLGSRRELRERERRLVAAAGGAHEDDAAPAPTRAATPWQGVPTPARVSAPADGVTDGSVIDGPLIGGPAAPAGPVGAAAVDSEPEVTSPGPRAADVAGAPHEPPRYTLRHYVALALVAVVLAFLVWTLDTRADDAGATSAAWSAVPPLPDLPAAHQGEL